MTSFTDANSITDSSNPELDSGKLRLNEPQVYRLVESRPAKFRSGLAAAAGFSGLALIFARFSIAPFIWSQFPRVLDVSRPDEAYLATLFLLLIPLPGMVAPFALWLGVMAWRDLNRLPGATGKIQAGFATVIGLLGTIILLTEIYQVTRALMFPI